MSLLNQPHSQYKEMQVKTGSQLSLILMLYNEVIRCLKVALQNDSFEKYDIFNRHLVRSQDIITEMMLAVQKDQSDFAKRLYHLYDYMNRELVQANIKKDIDSIKKIKSYLEELRDTWAKLNKQDKPSSKQQNGGSTSHIDALS